MSTTLPGTAVTGPSGPWIRVAPVANTRAGAGERGEGMTEANNAPNIPAASEPATNGAGLKSSFPRAAFFVNPGSGSADSSFTFAPSLKAGAVPVPVPVPEKTGPHVRLSQKPRQNPLPRLLTMARATLLPLHLGCQERPMNSLSLSILPLSASPNAEGAMLRPRASQRPGVD